MHTNDISWNCGPFMDQIFGIPNQTLCIPCTVFPIGGDLAILKKKKIAVTPYM